MKMVIYAFGGPEDNNRPVAYDIVDVNSITGIKCELTQFRRDNRGTTVVMCDAGPAVANAYREAKTDGSYMSWMAFYEYVKQRGFVFK